MKTPEGGGVPGVRLSEELSGVLTGSSRGLHGRHDGRPSALRPNWLMSAQWELGGHLSPSAVCQAPWIGHDGSLNAAMTYPATVA